MKSTGFLATATVVFIAATAAAQSERFPLTTAVTNLNRIGINYRMGLNLKASFHGVGAFAGPNAGPATGSAVNRFYDDGYNGVDSTGNATRGGAYPVTWNWGVNDVVAQILPSPSNPQSVVMHSDSSPGATVSDRSDDPQSGFEINYSRELLRKDCWRAGLEAAFGYTDFEVHDNSPVQIGVNRITDTYDVPPVGSGQGLPSTGSYNHGPDFLNGASNPVIDSTPSRLQDVLPGSVTGQRLFDADVFGFRLGPYVEVPLSRRVSLNFSGGLALAYVSSTFKFNQAVSVAGLGTQSQSGSGAHSGWLPGGYVAGNLSVAVSDSWALVAGAQFEDVGHYTQNLSGKQATLDLSSSVFATLGLSFSF